MNQPITNNTQLDILFVTPPISDVHLPFAAIPQLMGACKRAGQTCMWIDLGIVACKILFERHYKERAKKFLCREYYDERVADWGDSPVATFDEYLAKVSFLTEPDFSLERAKSVFQVGGMLEKGIIDALFDSILYFSTVTAKHEVFNVKEYFTDSSSGLIDECIANDATIELLKSDIRLVGITVTWITQFQYTKELITALKLINPSLKIVLGGSAITFAAKYSAENVEHLLDLSDFLIIGEGDTAIVKLAQYLSGDIRSTDEIPGLIYRNSEGILSNPTTTEDIETTSAPCFDGVDFNQYVLPDPMFPYGTSRGCFYGQCAFCDHDPDYRHNYRQKSVNKVITDILEIAKQTGLRNVQFTDEAIEPRFFKAMVHAMEESKDFRDISWFCYLRVSKLYDEETVRLAAKNGCRMVMFGIESFNQRLLTFIKKGHNAQVARDNLELFHKHRVKTLAWFMFGLPSETVEEALSDVDAIKEISDSLSGFSQGCFHISPNTDMSRDAARFNIMEYDAYDGFSFTTHNDGEFIDVTKVREAYESKIIPLKRRNYFSSNRYAIYYDDNPTTP